MTTSLRAGIVAGVVGVALLAAGCDAEGQASPKTKPTATPTIQTTTATPTHTPTPSTNPYEAKAIAAYKKAFETATAWALVGGLAPGNDVPAGLSETMTDQALTDQISALRQVYDLGLDRQSGEAVLGKIRRSTKQRAGNVVALDSCEDGRSIINKRPNGKTSRGRLIFKTSYYAVDQKTGTVKMTYYYGEEVTSCPIA